MVDRIQEFLAKMLPLVAVPLENVSKWRCAIHLSGEKESEHSVQRCSAGFMAAVRRIISISQSGMLRHSLIEEQIHLWFNEATAF